MTAETLTTFCHFFQALMHCRTVTKTINTSCINDMFSSYILGREAFLPKRHQDALVFTPQMHFGSGLCKCFLSASWRSFTLVFGTVHLWPHYPRRILIPSVNSVYNISLDIERFCWWLLSSDCWVKLPRGAVGSWWGECGRKQPECQWLGCSPHLTQCAETAVLSQSCWQMVVT